MNQCIGQGKKSGKAFGRSIFADGCITNAKINKRIEQQKHHIFRKEFSFFNQFVQQVDAIKGEKENSRKPKANAKMFVGLKLCGKPRKKYYPAQAEG